jgi:hypothetical protein
LEVTIYYRRSCAIINNGNLGGQTSHSTHRDIQKAKPDARLNLKMMEVEISSFSNLLVYHQQVYSSSSSSNNGQNNDDDDDEYDAIPFAHATLANNYENDYCDAVTMVASSVQVQAVVELPVTPVVVTIDEDDDDIPAVLYPSAPNNSHISPPEDESYFYCYGGDNHLYNHNHNHDNHSYIRTSWTSKKSRPPRVVSEGVPVPPPV